MSKMNKFNKYLYAFIFSILSMSIFIMKFEAYNPIFLKGDSVTNFFTEFEYAVNGFDVVYVTVWIFMLYFYFNVYFDGEKFNKKKLFCMIISIILTVVTVVGRAFSLSNSLVILYSSSMQIIKTVFFTFGYFLIYYALLRKLFNIKINLKNVKKKDLLFKNK